MGNDIHAESYVVCRYGYDSRKADRRVPDNESRGFLGVVIGRGHQWRTNPA